MRVIREASSFSSLAMRYWRSGCTAPIAHRSSVFLIVGVFQLRPERIDERADNIEAEATALQVAAHAPLKRLAIGRSSVFPQRATRDHHRPPGLVAGQRLVTQQRLDHRAVDAFAP